MTKNNENEGSDGKLLLYFFLVIALPIFVPMIGHYMYNNWSSVKKYGFFPKPNCVSLELWKKHEINGVIYKREATSRKYTFKYFIKSNDFTFYLSDYQAKKDGTKYTDIIEVGDTVINGIEDDILVIKERKQNKVALL